MNEESATYCRLCAELRPLGQMISLDKDVVANSKIITKLSWINVDIAESIGLPKKICYTCLDLLESTWTFLNNVRIAQQKLIAIFLNASKESAVDPEVELKDSDQKVPGKPVDESWEIFQELKREIKIENLNETVPQVFRTNTEVISDENNFNNIKIEADTDDDGQLVIDCRDDLDHSSSSDSDVPLQKTVKKKRGRPKKKEILNEPDKNTNSDYLASNVTWDSQSCVCAKCDTYCKSILSLQLHSLQIHDRCCVFKCVQCAKVSPGYRSFVRHTRTHNEALRYCCEYCNQMFSYLPQLSSHKQKKHKMVYKMKCTNCGANFETPEGLEEHKALFYKSPKVKKIVKDIKMEHKCDQCSKVFKTRANLHQHKQLHGERTKDFACHVCGKMFYTKGTLGTHLVVHEEKRPFKCNHCPLAFRAKGNLLSHLSLHSGFKPFICEQCGKSFRVKRHLMSHSIVHTDLRPYICEYCNKSFRFKTRLNLHLRQHTGVRPYKCIYCQRDFTNGSNYKKHMKRRHGIDTSTRVTSKNLLGNKKNHDTSTTVSQ